MTLVHWDDVEGFDISADMEPLGGQWQRLADAAGSVGLGAHRVRLQRGQMSTPPHRPALASHTVYVPASGG